MSMSKAEAIKSIAVSCKRACPSGFSNVSEFQNGIFEHADFLTPWTVGAKNFDADLMLVAQDWASSSWLDNPANAKYGELGRDPTLVTNKNIENYLELFSLTFGDTYATNAFPYIKSGNLSAKIKNHYFRKAVVDFLVPQMDVIRPKMVICLGSLVYNELRRYRALRPALIRFGHECGVDFDGSKLFGVYHPGGLGTASAGGSSEASKQWRKLSIDFKTLTG